MSEGGGLFAAIEGLLLLAVLLAAVTGAAWFLVQGSTTAPAGAKCTSSRHAVRRC